jgi:hypothetical protein
VSHFAGFDSSVEFDAGTLPRGLVTFNDDFIVNDKVSNLNIEHWHVCKIDGQWKILSVVWTVYR